MQNVPKKVRVMNMKMKNTPLKGRSETKIKMPNQLNIYKENHPKVFIKTFDCQMDAVLYDFCAAFEQD